MTLDLVDGILFLAPGFLAIKLFHMFGAQRSHSQWEWTVWSIIVSLPINGVAYLLRLTYPPPPSSPPDWSEVALRLLVASVAGLLAAWVWLRIKRSKRQFADTIRRSVSSSAWDLALEDVDRDERTVELLLDDGERFSGTLCYGGREDNEAEGWVYLTWPEERREGAWQAMVTTAGLLIHRDRIRRIRSIATKAEGIKRRADSEVPADRVDIVTD